MKLVELSSCKLYKIVNTVYTVSKFLRETNFQLVILLKSTQLKNTDYAKLIFTTWKFTINT